VTLPDLGSALPDIALRTAAVYVIVIALLRISGKRGVGQMSIVDLVLVLVISNAVQNAMVGENTTLYGGVVAAVTLVALDWLIRTISDRSTRVQRLLEGEPTLLVRDGQVLTRAMRKQGISHDELMAALRRNGLEHTAEAHLVVLETNGQISVVARHSGGAAEAPEAGPTAH
jgi:uncharacterized membrane protein YcaP (DUF421 family)